MEILPDIQRGRKGTFEVFILWYLEGGSGKLSSHEIQEGASNGGLGLSQMQLIVNPMDSAETGSNKRRKKDVAWLHCEALRDKDRVHIQCRYCGKVFKGGGIYRFKEHLAGRKGSAPICLKVPQDVRILMQQLLDELPARPSKGFTSEEMKVIASTPAAVDMFGHHRDDANTGSDAVEAYGSLGINLNSLLDQEVTGNGKEDGEKDKSLVNIGEADTLKSLGSENLYNPVHVKVGRLLYDIGISFDALDSTFFASLNGIVSARGSEVVAASSRDLRGWILKHLVKEVNDEIDSHKSTWGRLGCSVLVEERTSESGRIMLNFLVQCSQGTVFLKSIDASNINYSADSIYCVLKEVVENVGAEHVLQVITSIGEHYAFAGKNLMDNIPSLYWAPCAAQCIDLMLEDFGKIEWISAVVEQARSVTRFIYNQSAVLKLMRNFTFGNDILQQGATRSATNFTTLKRMTDFKLNLQTMVTSTEWAECPFSKQLGGLAALDTINNRSFWSSCILIIRLTSPLLRALHIVNSNKRGAVGYILAAIYRVKEAIKKELVKSEDYMMYWDIIDHRWQQQKHLPIQAAGFFLNPRLFYGNEGRMQNDILSKLFDCIERLVPDADVQDKIATELNLYKSAALDLGRKMAIRSRATMLPADWWSTYGGGCPNLARFAIRILSQPCGIPVCKWNHVSFDKMHSARNCLERQRLIDTVLVQCNLRLKQMKPNSADAITFDNINLIEDWIAVNEMCLENYGEMDWMSLIPTNTNVMQLASSVDEMEDLGTDFSDVEILNGLVQM
ncbi:hypothetical protein LINPERHAP2_LOCUS23304 [Linum perenne]